jgi:hypothetical protein
MIRDIAEEGSDGATSSFSRKKKPSVPMMTMILINGITQGTQRTFVKRFLLDVIDVTKLRFMVYNEKSNWLVIVAK